MILKFENSDDLDMAINYHTDIEKSGGKVNNVVVEKDELIFSVATINDQAFIEKFHETPSSMFTDSV